MTQLQGASGVSGGQNHLPHSGQAARCAQLGGKCSREVLGSAGMTGRAMTWQTCTVWLPAAVDSPHQAKTVWLPVAADSPHQAKTVWLPVAVDRPHQAKPRQAGCLWLLTAHTKPLPLAVDSPHQAAAKCPCLHRGFADTSPQQHHAQSSSAQG